MEVLKKALFDQVSSECSKMTTRRYSTSFSLGIYSLDRKFHEPIYNIYGFVRFADEIVDTFEGYKQAYLLDKFWKDTHEAIEQKISLNPILNSFQQVVHEYGIEAELYDTFMRSMEMDLDSQSNLQTHTRQSYEEYILGSAEVVGLMCLRVFTKGDDAKYQHLKPSAMRLGAAFQKVNFLRDVKADYEDLGRSYFPGVDLAKFSLSEKIKIEKEIEADFAAALVGIKQLPKGARRGVYIAYIYYKKLFDKIKSTPAERLMNERIRIPNTRKVGLLFNSLVRHSFNVM
ncbi:MAG: phytoene/squalene synthase family protein [Bacteroidota bacterium]